MTKPFKHIALWGIILVTLVTATEVLIVLGLISLHIPYKSDPLLSSIFFHYRKGFVPERELLLYAAALGMAITFFVGLMTMCWKRLDDHDFGWAFIKYGYVQLIVIGIELCFIFAVSVGVTAAWVSTMLYGSLIFSGGIKVFWSELDRLISGVSRYLSTSVLLSQRRILWQVITHENTLICYLALCWALQVVLFTGNTHWWGLSIGWFVLFKMLWPWMRNKVFAPLPAFMLCEGMITLLLWMSSAYRLIYVAKPQMAQGAFDALLIVAILTKLFWIYWVRLAKGIKARALDFYSRPASGVWLDVAAIFFILLVIFIPDPEAVVAQFFMGDYFHTWDVVFMGAVYGLFQGLIPCVEVNATYGLGMSVLMTWGMKLFGGFDYANALRVLITLGIIYYALWYLLLRKLLHSRLIAFAAIVIAMRSQMFIEIVVPMVWNEVQASILRYCFDVFFFWCLWQHAAKRKSLYLWGMAIFAAWGFYHMPTTGIFLCVIFFFYYILNILRTFVGQSNPGFVRALVWARPAVFIPIFIAVFFYLTVGPHLIESTFWWRLSEFTGYFVRGFFYSQIFSALAGGEYLKVLIGLLFPILYLASAFYTGFRFCFSQDNRVKEVFICTLAIYGLGLFTYYVGMSHKYWSVGLPAVFIFSYWVDKGILLLSFSWQPKVKWTLLGICMFSLLTTQMFMAYPNFLNLSRNPIVDKRVALRVGHNSNYFHQLSIDFPAWLKVPLNSLGEQDEQFRFENNFINHDALKSYYRQEIAFTEDAALIDRFSSLGARVPLLSSFEVMILSKANRKPFFYYFPLLNSHPMRMRNFVVTTIFAYPQLMGCLAQLEGEKPPYIFIENVFRTAQVPLWYGEQFEDLISLIRYVEVHYEPVAIGKYLVAMKRKDDK